MSISPQRDGVASAPPCDAQLRRDLGEFRRPIVPIHEVAAVSGHEQIEIAIVVVIRNAGAITAGRLRTAGGVHPELLRDVHEARAVVAEEAVQIAVLVGNEHVEVAVLIHVEPHGADGPAGIVDPHVLGDVRKRLAVVAEEQVRRVAQADKEIEVAVIVEIDERRLPGLAGRVDAHRLRHVHERLAGALIAIQLARDGGLAREAHEQVDVAVAVEIAPGRRARVVEIGDTHLGANLDERAVVIAIQLVRHAFAEADEEIEIAVVVVVGPAIGLASRGREEIRLHQLELRLGRHAAFTARRARGVVEPDGAKRHDRARCQPCSTCHPNLQPLVRRARHLTVRRFACFARCRFGASRLQEAAVRRPTCSEPLARPNGRAPAARSAEPAARRSRANLRTGSTAASDAYPSRRHRFAGQQLVVRCRVVREARQHDRRLHEVIALDAVERVHVRVMRPRVVLEPILNELERRNADVVERHVVGS